MSRRDDRCNLFLAGVIHAGCFHGNDQLRRFDLDGHSSGRSCVFLVARSRGECPIGFIVARVRIDLAICPCKRTVDCIIRGGVFHLARNFALAQCIAVGNLACGDCAVRRGLDLVRRVDLDSQSDVLIVFALDYHGHCTHRTSGSHVIFLNGQGQLAVFHIRAAGVVAVIEFDFAQLIGGCTVLFGRFQRGQGGERHSVGLFVAVYNGERSFLGEVRRSGLGDVASGHESALLQGVILRCLLRQGHCGSDALAVAHTGIVKAGGDGVVCASVQGHIVEGHAGDVRVFRAIINFVFCRNAGNGNSLRGNHKVGCRISGQRVIAVGNRGCNCVAACINGNGCVIVSVAGVGKRYRNVFPFHSAGKFGSGGDDTAVSAAVRDNGNGDFPGGDGGSGFGLIAAFSQHIVVGRIAAQLKVGNLDFLLLTDTRAFQSTCGSNG